MKYYRMRQHDGLGECNSFVQNDLKFLRLDDILMQRPCLAGMTSFRRMEVEWLGYIVLSTCMSCTKKYTMSSSFNCRL